MKYIKNILTTLVVLLLGNIGYCQDSSMLFFPDVNKYDQIKIGYITGGIGFGGSYLKATDITDWFGLEAKSMEKFALSGSFNTRIGIRNIFQYEYKQGRDLGGHDILISSNTTINPDGSFEFDEEKYDFKYYYTEHIFKFNPLFFLKKKEEYNMGLFLDYGFGEVNYLDKSNDGWKGKSRLYGLEFFMLEKYKSFVGIFSFKILKSDIDFNQDILYGISQNSDFTGSQFAIEFSVNMGFGY